MIGVEPHRSLNPLDPFFWASEPGQQLALLHDNEVAVRIEALIKNRARFALGMQHVTWLTPMPKCWTNWDLMFRFSNRRQIKVRPAVLLQEMTDKVVGMQPLHDHDDGVVDLVVQAAEQRVRVPLLAYASRHAN
jgi:hypothetical protein